MNGYLPAQADKSFVINGTKFHYGVQGNESEESLRATLVREAVAGGGAYSGTGASATWVKVHDMDLSTFLYNLDDSLTRTQQLDSAFYMFTEDCNVAIEAFKSGSGGTPPTFPTDLYQQCKWYIGNRVSFNSTTKQMVFA